MLNWLSKLLGALAGRLQSPAPAAAPAVGDVLEHETQSFAETLARIAESQLRECPQGRCEVDGNNRGPMIREYQRATWLTPGAWPWCAAFVCWCVWRAIDVAGGVSGWTRPRTASAYDLEKWADGLKPHAPNGGWATFDPRHTAPRRGDIVTFTWSHTGIVTGYDAARKLVYTVEGNAGAGNVSDSAAGDGVVAKTHSISKLRRILRHVG